MICGRKKKYPTQEIAEDALIEARTAYDYPNGGGPVGVYLCDECGQYHLTSQGAINPKLAEYIQAGKLKLNKEANLWLGKLTKR